MPGPDKVALVHQIVTERLMLRQRTLTELRALLEGRPSPGLPWAPGYPLDGTLVAAALLVSLADQGTDSGMFGQYQVIRRSDHVVIGDIGFYTPPDELGSVTVGFGIVPPARGQGYAREGLRAVLDWALGEPDVRVVRADTDLVNIASQHVLEAAGMHVVSDEDDRKVYAISAPAASRA